MLGREIKIGAPFAWKPLVTDFSTIGRHTYLPLLCFHLCTKQVVKKDRVHEDVVKAFLLVGGKYQQKWQREKS